MGRRGENIRKRKDGRWEARVIQGRPICGKTNYKYFYGKSYREVKNRKEAFLAEREAAALKPLPSPAGLENLLFQDVAAGWLAAKKAVVRESTFACYTFLVEKHLLPVFGDTPVLKVDTGLLTVFLERQKTNGRLRGGPLSNKTLSDIKAILMQILRFAKQLGAISAVPKCPTVASHQHGSSVFTVQEQKKLEMQAIKENTPFSLGILLSLYSGIRIGETCGIQWGDFDFKNGTICINKTVYRITETDKTAPTKTKVIIGTPKTDCSLRTIPLPTPVLQYFMERRCARDCYVLTGTTKYMEPRVCLNRYKRLLHRAGVTDHTFHTLRHTFATRCVENNVDIKSLSEMMGHSDVKITMQRYVHPSMDTKRMQVNKLPCFAVGGRISGQANKEIA